MSVKRRVQRLEQQQQGGRLSFDIEAWRAKWQQARESGRLPDDLPEEARERFIEIGVTRCLLNSE